MELSVGGSSGCNSTTSLKYIQDKNQRTKSYLRRRPVPFKRIMELDLQIGSKSLLVQCNGDIDEALYVGDDDLVQRFVSQEGLQLSHLQNLCIKGQVQAQDENQSHHHYHWGGSNVDSSSILMDDDDYSPTVEERKKKERLKKKEAQQRVSDGEYLTHPAERAKFYKTRKDIITAKINELEVLCAARTFMLIILPEKEYVYYQGDKRFIHQFFNAGFSSYKIPVRYNIRPFEMDESDFNTCSVPHCIVTRNTLSKWRQAAIDLYKFPDNIPMTLYPCPEADRDQWIAELDLDPNSSSKIAVCSLHFKEGYPTRDIPYPSELLTEVKDTNEKVIFSGTQSSSWRTKNNSVDEVDNVDKKNNESIEESAEIKNNKFKVLSRKKLSHKERNRRKFALLSNRNDSKKPSTRRKFKSRNCTYSFFKWKKMYINNRRSFGPYCLQCSQGFRSYKSFFIHYLTEHQERLNHEKKEVNLDQIKMEANENLNVNDENPIKNEIVEVHLSQMEKRQCLSKLYPNTKSTGMNPKKKYVCAHCKSVCDLYGLFIHMKTVHKGILCLYCLKLFQKVPDLESHLRMQHKVIKRYYHSVDEFKEYAGTKYNVICASCNKVVKTSELERHICNNAKKYFDCPFCERDFREAHQLEMHIVNGWCTHMTTNKSPSLKEVRKLYKVLTGLNYDPAFTVIKSPPQTLCSKPISSKQSKRFSVNDRQLLLKYTNNSNNNKSTSTSSSSSSSTTTSEEVSNFILPPNGNIYISLRSKGISSDIKKEIKTNGNDTHIRDLKLTQAGNNFVIHSEEPQNSCIKSVPPIKLNLSGSCSPSGGEAMRSLSNLKRQNSRNRTFSNSNNRSNSTEDKENVVNDLMDVCVAPFKETKQARIERESNEIYDNLENIRKTVDAFNDSCLVCQQAHIVSVDVLYLISHLSLVHDRGQIEELLQEDPSLILSRIKRHLKDTKTKELLFTWQHQDFSIDYYFCSYCSTTDLKSNEQLFQHLESEHRQKVLTCNLCLSIFLNYGSFISHVCYGPINSSNSKPKSAKFNCKICLRQDLSTFLLFQNHIRRDHNICEICFKEQENQLSLYHHCLSHNQELMCMKCFLSYDEFIHFRKHLYHKHDDESRLCSNCHHKTWPHVYHFCIMNLPSTCEVCDKEFQSIKKYRVHMRTHTNVNPYVCNAANCNKGFISKQLLWKHQIRRHPKLSVSATKALEDKRDNREIAKYNAKSIESVRNVQSILNDLLIQAVKEDSSEEEEEEEDEESDNDSKNVDTPPPTNEEKAEEYDPLQAAVASIMGSGGIFNTKKSPVKQSHLIISPSPTRNPAPPPPSSIPVRPNITTSQKAAAPPPEPMHPSEYFGNQYPDSPPPLIVNNGGSPQKRHGKEPVRSSSDSEPDSDNNKSKQESAPVMGGIWNQDLCFLPSVKDSSSSKKELSKGKAKVRKPNHTGGLKVMKPEVPSSETISAAKALSSLNPNSIATKLGKGGWDLCLSEDSDESGDEKPKKPKVIDRNILDDRASFADHDYCYTSYLWSQEPPKPPELSEMDKILSNVALGVVDQISPKNQLKKKHKKKDKKKKKKKRKNKRKDDSSSDSDNDSEKRTAAAAAVAAVAAARKAGPKPKYHTSISGGAAPGKGRITFHSSSEDERDADSSSDICSSDLDTDFSADEEDNNQTPRQQQQLQQQQQQQGSLKLKIRLSSAPTPPPPTKLIIPKRKLEQASVTKSKRNKPLSKKMRESLALNQPSSSSSSEYDDNGDDDDDVFEINTTTTNSNESKKKAAPPKIKVKAPSTIYYPQEPQQLVATEAYVDDKLYCVCQCPHDDVSEMIGCDAPDCAKEWFHFECVGILVPPAGKWFCPECSDRYKYGH